MSNFRWYPERKANELSWKGIGITIPTFLRCISRWQKIVFSVHPQNRAAWIMAQFSPGGAFREAVRAERPLQIIGTINALCAMQAARAGFRSIYLSGAGVANASYGLPDLGITNLNDVLIDASRITAASSLPLLVDIDTGWGSELSIGRAIRELERVGVAAVHMEDQVTAKRCGHRPGKQLVDTSEMQARIRAAIEHRTNPEFVIMARTDAASVEGIDQAIARAVQYVSAGADMIFAEALQTLEDFHRFTKAVEVPVLANMTEFGKTPYFSLDELRSVGIRMALYPLTAFRAMNAAAKTTYELIRKEGTQKSLLSNLQTREQLYELLDYYTVEQRIDQENTKQ